MAPAFFWGGRRAEILLFNLLFGCGILNVGISSVYITFQPQKNKTAVFPGLGIGVGTSGIGEVIAPFFSVIAAFFSWWQAMSAGRMTFY